MSRIDREDILDSFELRRASFLDMGSYWDIDVIGSSAFMCSSVLETIVLPRGLRKIEESAFRECVNLKTVDIPEDYDGVMGVPITFMDKYCPEQFEIVGMCENENLYNLKTRVYNRSECQNAYYVKFGKKGSYDLNASGVLTINGIQEKVYQRILIRKRRIQSS